MANSFSAAILALALLFTSQVQALYFYMDSTVPKCFYEELPKDTLVVGTWKKTAYSDLIAASRLPLLLL